MAATTARTAAVRTVSSRRHLVGGAVVPVADCSDSALPTDRSVARDPTDRSAAEKLTA